MKSFTFQSASSSYYYSMAICGARSSVYIVCDSLMLPTIPSYIYAHIQIHRGSRRPAFIWLFFFQAVQHCVFTTELLYASVLLDSYRWIASPFFSHFVVVVVAFFFLCSRHSVGPFISSQMRFHVKELWRFGIFIRSFVLFFHSFSRPNNTRQMPGERKRAKCKKEKKRRKVMEMYPNGSTWKGLITLFSSIAFYNALFQRI